ncbi:ATP-binding protein [Candidatus Magnetaquicoccus inordinatus]|uniref:ATP-binding protein n=1 Tax=Candidatus Magnetaquicoccus inordinatus TaxID=2496818 RepID=UPI00102AAC77|nr:ATP-binding protein [Candidatus Magnetaquicoccus inordinatus]
MHSAKREILLKFFFVVALVVLAGSAGIYWQQTTYNEQRLRETTSEIRYTLELVMQQQTTLMQMVLSTLQEQDSLRTAFRERNRPLLLLHGKPMLEAWGKTDAITHLYFHLPSGHNLLRVHQPERYGDLIDRHTLHSARTFNRFSAGLELGPLGTLSLRAVTPWHEGEQLLGFLEMAKELYLLTAIIPHQYNVDLYLFLDKRHLKQAEWLSGAQRLGRTQQWDQFAHHVLIGQSSAALPPFLHTLESELSHSGEQSWHNVPVKNEHYNLARLPLHDSSGNEIGLIAIVQNTTEAVHRSQQWIGAAAAIGLLGGSWLMILFGGLLDQWEKKWQTTHAELEERDARLRLTQATTQDAIITIDEHGVIQECNPAAGTLFGYAHGALLKQNVADCIIPHALRDKHRQALLRHSQAHAVLAPFLSFRRKAALPGLHADGHIIDLEVELIGLFLAGKRHFTAFVRDVTERKQLLRSLDETLSAAESANRMKSEFLANMSHEIRTPMNGIIGMTDLLLTMPLSPQEQRCNLEIILQSSQTLLGLINNILDYSKFDAGMVTLERVSFDLSGQMETVCNNLAIKAHQQGLELYCYLDPQLPVTLNGDPLRLRQVLLNLVNNAIKFTSEGEVVLEVEPDRESPLTSDSNEHWLLFHVRDSGIGIPAEKLPTLFARFTQVDGSTTRKYGGTGLGLAISKHLVSLMGGQIMVQSQPGQGSTFSFRACFAPAERQKSLNDDLVREERRSDALPHACRHLRILLADAHAVGRRIVKEIVQQAGGEVVEVTDLASLLREQALAQQQEQPFDLLLLDHGLLQGRAQQSETLFWQGAGERIILLLPAHISLDSLQHFTWLQRAKALRKPIFKFRLLKMIQQILSGEKEGNELPMTPTVAARQGAPLRILLVEDNPNNQKLAIAILQQVGHQVMSANHGREALQLLARYPFDLLLMDLQMPEMDGFATTQAIRAADPGQPYSAQIPIIAVTAKSADQEEKHCLAAGMNGYLKKPYRSHELLSTIDAVMKQYQQALRSPAACGQDLLQQLTLTTAALQQLEEPILHKLPQVLESLTQAVASENALQVDKWVSWLGDAARSIGVKPLSLQGMRLRSCAEQNNWSGAQEALSKLLLCCQQTSLELQQRKEK